MESELYRKCSVTETLKLFSAKWKPCILCHLDVNPRRFGALQKLMPKVSRRMLTQHLKELESDGLIKRKSYPVIPPRVEYSLTDLGRSLIPLLKDLEQWGLAHLNNVRPIHEMLESSM